MWVTCFGLYAGQLEFLEAENGSSQLEKIKNKERKKKKETVTFFTIIGFQVKVFLVKVSFSPITLRLFAFKVY